MLTLHVVYQPIICYSQRRVIGHEALVRSTDGMLNQPSALFDAAERVGQLVELGRAIRAHAAKGMSDVADLELLFVNLHTQDLLDDTLFSADTRLARVADRVVLEITERASLHDVRDAHALISRLRKLGYRLAVDDLGAGYAGLTSFALLEPDVVKVDMSLVRGVDHVHMKQKLVRSMVQLCSELGIMLIAEGVETRDELRSLVDLGCDVFQGFLFARPGPAFPEVDWSHCTPA